MGSNWKYICTLKVDMNIAKYNPLKTSSYIELPIEIKNKRACVNVKNKDNKCFLWAVTSALYPVKNNVCCTSSYKKNLKYVNDEDITYPFDHNNVNLEKFEIKNNVSIIFTFLSQKM